MSLAPVDQPGPLLPAAAATTVGPVALRDELALWKDAFDFAKVIAPTDFVPKALRNNPPAVMACIIKGHELGVSALHSLSSIHIIDGRPSLSAELQRALVQSRGHSLWTEDYTVSRVTLCGQRQGEPHVQKVTWTTDDAKRANLLGRPNWRSYPRDMLLARASGALCRIMFADVIAGMSYNVEEVEDMLATGEWDPDPGPSGGELPAAKPAAKRTRRVRKSAAAPPPAAAGPPGSDPATADPGGPPPALPGEEGYEDDPRPPSAVETTSRPGERHSGPDPVESEPPDRAENREPRTPDPGPTTSGEPEELVTKRAQAIAIQARDADVDHHDIVRHVTAGRYESAKDLNAAEADAALHAIAAIRSNRAHLEIAEDEEGRHVDLVDGPAPSKVDEYHERIQNLRRQQHEKETGGQQELDTDTPPEE